MSPKSSSSDAVLKLLALGGSWVEEDLFTSLDRAPQQCILQLSTEADISDDELPSMQSCSVAHVSTYSKQLLRLHHK